ncbi:MAG: GntR family transcriptional regulator [Chloroflexi bacterium]|nr:GntR family transcriptional regulator [Chloroflexota bacterium]
MKVFSQIRPVSLREQVAEQIRTAIIEGRLKPNDHVVEAALTEQLGVSRTPVREALIILEREALIVTVPHRGAFVRAFNEEDVEALFSMRTTLENFAAELVIDRLGDQDYTYLEDLVDRQRHYIEQNDFKQVRSTDMAFHQYLISYSGHPLLMRSWEEIVAQVAAVLYLRAEAQPDYDEYLAISDHCAILDAYRARDLEKVKAENRRINNRVAAECLSAVRVLKGRADGSAP